MANKQTYPNALNPLNGDVESTVGGSTATVTGIQNIPVDPTTPLPQQILVMGSDGEWHPEDPIVSGPDAPGDVSTGDPVQIGGIDDGNRVREIRTDTYGSIQLSMYDRNLLEQIMLSLRALVAATIADKPVADSEFVSDNFSDSSVGA